MARAMMALIRSGAEHRDDAERQDQQRESQQPIHDAHDDGIEQASDIAGQQSDRTANGQREQDGNANDLQRRYATLWRGQGPRAKTPNPSRR